MGDYKGAKYVGDYPVRVPKLGGGMVNPGDVVDIPEEEARAREDFEPVYEKSVRGGAKEEGE
jgi:hypothetical protein